MVLIIHYVIHLNLKKCSKYIYHSKACSKFAFAVNSGEYINAVFDRNVAENISRVLYPNDNVSLLLTINLCNKIILNLILFHYAVQCSQIAHEYRMCLISSVDE